MKDAAHRHMAIVGGGASGVILAAHLWRAHPAIRISLIDPSDEPGRGRAYSTGLEDHILNVPAVRMGAWHDEPDHFLNWHRRNFPEKDAGEQDFLPRRDYGRYLGELFGDMVAAADGRVRHVRATCLSLSCAGSGVELRLSNGTSLAAHAAVLATGHDASTVRPYAVMPDRIPPVGPLAPVAIIGTGLSMIDAWLSLRAAGHRGTVTAISRRGLLPRSHASRRAPIPLDLADIPLGTELSYFVRWFADLLAETRRNGGDWRDVVDGIRPFNQQIWRNWPLSARRRFLKHVKPWWDVHRHRVPRHVHAQLAEAQKSGRLRIERGSVVDGRIEPDGTTTLILRPRGDGGAVECSFATVVDCTGIVRDPADSTNALIATLIASRMARPDPLRIGIDVSDACRLIDADGTASDRLYAVGPITRGAFYEIEAVPDIRAQCARLADGL